MAEAGDDILSGMTFRFYLRHHGGVEALVESSVRTEAQSSNLKVLDLAWNALHGEAAEALLEGVYENNKAADARHSGGLRRLSLAWNRSAKLLSSIFEDCTTLFHLDLSYNGFGAEDFSEATTLDLKLAIQARLAVPRKEQRLTAGQLLLHDGLRLANIAAEVVDEDDILQICLLRLDGARPGMVEGLASGWLALQDLSEELRGDKELVLAAVSANGWCLEFASFLLRGDRDVAMAAVQSDAAALEFVSESLKRDRGVVLAAAQRNGWALAFAPDLQADKEIVLAAVASNPLSLQFASEELRSDPQVVLKAVSLKGCALRFAAPHLRRDSKIVRSAVKSDAAAIELASGINWRKCGLHLVGNEAMVDDLGFIAAKFRRRRSVIPPPHLCIDTSICPASCLSAGKYWELLSIHVLLQIFMPCDTLSFCAPEAFSAPEAAAFSSVRDFVLGS
ncbi:Calcium-dependent protein kinase 26 [Durusdinium trenchii]|uniref:Calcium-dependent protein kinase 26 n=1 Tax=Durusdinium trenchii TaxID=1381693 RepID=A0ABP0J9S1_9DINO